MSIAEYYEMLMKKAQPGERAFIHRGLKNNLGHVVVEPRPNGDHPNLPLIELYFIPSGKAGKERLDELNFNGWDEYTGAPALEHVKTAREKADEMRAQIEAEMRAKIEAEMKDLVKIEEPAMKLREGTPEPEAVAPEAPKARKSPVKRRRSTKTKK